MKLESLSVLVLLAALGRAETPQIPISAERAQSPQLADYHALCSAGQDTGTKTFDNGVTAEYTCRVKASSDIDPTEEPATSSEECATKCGSGCSGAVWQYTKNRCLLYNSGVTLSPHARGSVYLKPSGTAEGPPEDEESDCQHEREACEDELDALKGQLEGEREYNEHCERDKNDLRADIDDLEIDNKACQQEKDDLDTKNKACQQQLDACQNLQGSLQQQVDVCQNSKDAYQKQLSALQQELRASEAANTNLLTSASVCYPGYKGKDNQTLRQGRGTFKFSCKAKRTGAVLRTTGHGFEMCLQACARNPECGGANYWTHKPDIAGRCEMLKGSPGWANTSEKVIGAIVQGRH